MNVRPRIILKITGNLFLDDQKNLNCDRIHSLVKQILQLHDRYQFGIVVGGGNILRGNSTGLQLGISPMNGHQVGMLATIINGVLLKDIFEQYSHPATILSALAIPDVGPTINPSSIAHALQANQTIIFVGGTGNPFFTTDTCAVLRSLQIDAQEVWKATSVDGVYTADPRMNAHATYMPSVSFEYALSNNLGVMDKAALALAQEYTKPIRIFNAFINDSLIKAADHRSFGSIISN